MTAKRSMIFCVALTMCLGAASQVSKAGPRSLGGQNFVAGSSPKAAVKIGQLAKGRNISQSQQQSQNFDAWRDAADTSLIKGNISND